MKRILVFLDASAAVAVLLVAALFVVRWFGLQPGNGSEQGSVEVPSQSIQLAKGASTGSPQARIGLLEFTDVECPYCGRFATEVLPFLRKEFIDPGVLLLEIRQLPLRIHKNARTAAIALICAGEQGRFEPLHNLLFANQENLDGTNIDRFAAEIGIEQTGYARCMGTTGAERLSQDLELAKVLKVSSTPMFFLGTLSETGNMVISARMKGAQPSVEFAKAIRKLLKKG